jgi:alkylation response protein AidB-like acyl-CoA dehydrogenase
MDFQLTEFQRHLIAMVRKVGEERFASSGFAPGDSGLSRGHLRLLARQGLSGIALPEQDGGQGGSLLDAVLAMETLAQYSAPGGDALQALNFGAIQQIARHGLSYQKERFLAPCLAGARLVTIAMTEPEAGSAVTDLKSTARHDGDECVLNGQKTFTTNSDRADLFVVWVRFGQDARSAGAVIVERDTPGFEIDSSHRFLSGERYGMLYLDDCRVPREHVLLAEDGFRRMFAVFNIERLGNASRSLGYAQAAFDRAVAHARERRQFGRRLLEFQGLQWAFAEMKVKIDAARLLLYRAAANADDGLPSALESSIAKLACNRTGFDVANAALQVLGAYGYEAESDVSYIFRRTRGWLIAGGTEQQLLNRIAQEVFGERLSQRLSATPTATGR